MKHAASWFMGGLCEIGILLCFPSAAKTSPAIQEGVFHFKSRLPPSQIAINPDSLVFSKATDGRLNFGFCPREYCYIVLKINAGRTPGSYALSIDNTSLDTVQIFSLTPGRIKKLLYQGGNMIKYQPDRTYVWHTLMLNRGFGIHYYLIAVRAMSKNVNLQYRIMQPHELQALYQNFDRFIWFYLGITLFIMMGSVIAFLLRHNLALLLYTGYLSSVAVWILSHYGYFFPLFHPSFPRLNDVIKLVSSLLAVIFFLSLIVDLFLHGRKRGIMLRVIRYLIAANLLLISLALIHLIVVFTPAVLLAFNIAWHILLILSACTAVPVLLVVSRTVRSAKVFCFAAACPFIMLFIQVFSNAGYIKNEFLNNHGVLLANLAEIFILLCAIIYNLWDKEKLKDEQLRLLEEDRKETLKKLITVQDQERKRIAEDLHDSIGPMLAAIKINFMRALKAENESHNKGMLVAKTEHIIDDSINEIRAISHQLMPKGLSSKGLVTLLKEYFNNLESLYAISITFISDITIALNSDLQLNLYRIICELALNAAKHGSARSIFVSLKTSEHSVHIVAQDDGAGFAVVAKSPGVGLKNIESRTAYLKGILDIHSSPGEGSCVEIIIPLTET